MSGWLWSGMGVLCGALLLSACNDDSGHGHHSASPSAPPGELVQGFGVDGVVSPDLGGVGGYAKVIAVDSPWMYVGGRDTAPGSGEWRIEKRKLSDGTLDPGFGTGGVVAVDPTPESDQVTCIVLNGGALYVAGSQGLATMVSRIEKRSAADGSLDPVFGGGSGVLILNTSIGLNHPDALAVADQDLFIAGGEFGPAPGQAQWILEKRDATTGDLNPGFGAGTGIVRSDPGTGYDSVRTLAVDSGSLYLAGVQQVSAGDYGWRFEKRERSTGNLDGTFGGGTGAVTSNPTLDSDEEPSKMILAGPSLYIAGFHHTGSPPVNAWRVEKRDSVTGALDGIFGNGTGVVTANPGYGGYPAGGLATDGSFLYVAGPISGSLFFNPACRIEKRDLVTGALQVSFGTGGGVNTDPSPGFDFIQDIAVDGSFIYTAGYQEGSKWRLEKRAK